MTFEMKDFDVNSDVNTWKQYNHLFCNLLHYKAYFGHHKSCKVKQNVLLFPEFSIFHFHCEGEAETSNCICKQMNM